MNELYGISWASPLYAWLILVVVIASALLAYRFRAIAKAIHLIAGNLALFVIKNYSAKRQIFKGVLLCSALLFLVFALMRPQMHEKEEIVAQEGRDVLIALDISRSMLATDCAPDRLTCAKQKIKQLLNTLTCERVGLILFSGAAIMQCPLTSDYGSFCMFLDHVDAETISSGSTALAGAIHQAVQIFEAMPNRKSKLLVIFTDGEDFSSDLKRYKTKAQEQNLHIFTVGVGTTQGAPIPLYDEAGKQVGHQKDERGTVVISRLNEEVLTALAHDAGGVYVTMARNDRDVQTLLAQINVFEREWIEDKKVAQLQDVYHYCLLMSLICFACEWII